MPEGPEIRRAADRVSAALAGRRATAVYFGLPRLMPYAAELEGRTVRHVEARGKAMLVTFTGGWHVYSHNQLYGRWYVRCAGDLPRTGRSLRFAVHNRTASALLYSASDIDVLQRDELGQHPYLSRLGPDPLDEATTPGEVVARAGRNRFRRRSFAALLLDQSFLAGIGNYLRSEILYFARLHPARRPVDASRGDLARLGRQALAVARRSYATGGITNTLTKSRALARRGVPRRVHRHAVFGLDGHACPRCGDPIVRAMMSGRRIYLCETCQPLRSGGSR